LKQTFTATGIRFDVPKSFAAIQGFSALCASLAVKLVASGVSKEGVHHGRG
jgi:hypothetical protein